MKVWQRIGLTCVFLAAVGATHATVNPINPINSQASKSQVINLKLERFPSLVAHLFDDLVLIKVDSGEIKTIPFQFDDMNVEGTPYTKSLSIDIAGEEGVVDPADELLFMARDGGEKLENSNFRVLQEIEYHHERKTRYVYVAKKSAVPGVQPSDTNYVHYSESEAAFQSEQYSLSTDKKNPLKWRDLTFTQYSGSEITSLLDTMKVRISAGVVTSFPRITITNDNMDAKIIEIIEGPIRTMVQTEATVVVMKVPVMKVHTLLVGYESRVDTVIRAQIPKVFGKLMKKPEITLSLDGNALEKAKVVSANKPSEPFVVDGKMSRSEKVLADSNYDKETWWWLSTGKNFDWIMNLVPGNQFSPQLSAYYVDDRKEKDKPERFKGQWPNMGYRLTSIDANQVINFTIQIFFSSGKQDAKLSQNQYLSQFLSQPDITLPQENMAEANAYPSKATIANSSLTSSSPITQQ